MGFAISRKPLSLPGSGSALPDRQAVMKINPTHYVSGNPIIEPVPDALEKAVFGLGCFWGAERKFWQIPGVFSTAAGYAGGITANPTYQDVCSGMTGHTEAVLVFYDPRIIGYESLLKTFWESHDPTQGMRQGNDHGTQYRSAVYFSNDQQEKLARMSLGKYQQALLESGMDAPITTELAPLGNFYYAEDYHQQYLAKNPRGYCGLGGTGVCYEPI